MPTLLERLKILNARMDGTLEMSKHGVFEHMIAHSPIGMFLVNQRGELLIVNRYFEDVFGYEEGELDGVSVDVLVPRDVREEHPKMRAQATDCMQRMYLRTVRGERKDGTEMDVEIALQPISVNGGTKLVIGVAVSGESHVP